MRLPVALAAAEPAVGETTPLATLTDWHIDDMWGVYPRPHEAIGFGRRAAPASSRMRQRGCRESRIIAAVSRRERR